MALKSKASEQSGPHRRTCPDRRSALTQDFLEPGACLSKRIVCFRYHACTGLKDMLHFWKYLQSHRHASMCCARRQSGGVVEQGLIATDLDAKRGQACQVAIQRCRQWVARRCARQKQGGHADQCVSAHHQVCRSLGRHGLTRSFQVNPGRKHHGATGLCQALSLGGQKQRDGQASARRISRHTYPGWREALLQQPPISQQRIVDGGRVRMLGGQTVVHAEHVAPTLHSKMRRQLAVSIGTLHHIATAVKVQND